MLVPRPHPYYSSRHHDWGRESWDAFHVLGRGRPGTHTLVVQQEHNYRDSIFHYRDGGKKDFTKPGNNTRGLVLLLPWPISGPIFARSIAKIFLEGITR